MCEREEGVCVGEKRVCVGEMVCVWEREMCERECARRSAVVKGRVYEHGL